MMNFPPYLIIAVLEGFYATRMLLIRIGLGGFGA
jgi:hypothetical protein